MLHSERLRVFSRTNAVNYVQRANAHAQAMTSNAPPPGCIVGQISLQPPGMERTGGPGVIPALRVSVFTEQVEAMIFAPHVHAVDGGVHGQNDRFTSAVHLRLWSSTERRQCAREAS